MIETTERFEEQPVEPAAQAAPGPAAGSTGIDPGSTSPATPAPAPDTVHSPGVEAAIERGAARLEAMASERARMRSMRFDTIAVHGLYSMAEALANQGSINEPAYLSPAQHFATSDEMEAALAYLAPSWAYSRIANPTLGYLEETLALLEG